MALMASRKMRSHRKSRQGCGNCKMRKVKCDENKPICRKCDSYGIYCNYDPRYSDLQPFTDGTRALDSPRSSPCSEIDTVLGVINTSPHSSNNSSPVPTCDYQFTPQDLECLHRFHTRTVWTLGTARNRSVYRDAVSKLAYSHPFLLHVALTLTTMHDAYLSLGNPSTNNNLIAFHWSQGASLLNARLTNGIDPSERDALWACSTLLGALSFCSTPARCPQESWPLKPDPSGSDLDWLKMTEGKKAIWKLSDPLREDSIFYPHMADFIPGFAALAPSAQSLDTLPRELVELCGINTASPNSDNNPNAPLLNLLTHFLPLPCNATTLGRFMSFFGCMSPSYRLLLAHKDPGALLLLAYWYAKLLDYRQWWLLPRARVECAAICIHLELCHGHEGNIMRLVEFPKTACGLVDREEALSEKVESYFR